MPISVASGRGEGERAFMTGGRSLEEWDPHVEAMQAEERARELGILE